MLRELKYATWNHAMSDKVFLNQSKLLQLKYATSNHAALFKFFYIAL